MRLSRVSPVTVTVGACAVGTVFQRYLWDMSSNNIDAAYETGSTRKLQRPSPLCLENVKRKASRTSLNEEPDTPMSSERFEYSTYCTRYNWPLSKELVGLNGLSISPKQKSYNNHCIHPENVATRSSSKRVDWTQTKLISTNYTKYLIKPRSPSSKWDLKRRNDQTNYRTTYRRRKGSTWYTTVHVWSTNANSPENSPVRKVRTIRGLQDSAMSPRKFSLN